jgi:hypothetical protein
MKSGRVSIVGIGLCCVMTVALTGVPIRGQEPAGTAAAQTQPYRDSECTGFISEVPIKSSLKLVGSNVELQSYAFTQGHAVYLDKGLEQGIKPGTVYAIVRPMGEMKQPFTKRSLGYYVKQVGLLTVESVQGGTSRAIITESCNEIWVSDLLIPYEPATDTRAEEIRVAASKIPDSIIPDSTITKGQIVLARDMREYLGTNDIVFVDIGAGKGVHPGDSFTIYRPVGQSEGFVPYLDQGVQSAHQSSYGSDRYRGGEYSVDTPVTPRDKIEETRPTLPRKVVGQLVLLKVDKNASVARIVQINEEVNVGDYVQLNGN